MYPYASLYTLSRMDLDEVLRLIEHLWPGPPCGQEWVARFALSEPERLAMIAEDLHAGGRLLRPTVDEFAAAYTETQRHGRNPAMDNRPSEHEKELIRRNVPNLRRLLA